MKARIDDSGQTYVLCTDCGTAIAQVIGDCLVVKVKHHGSIHVSVLLISQLISLTVTEDAREKVKRLA